MIRDSIKFIIYSALNYDIFRFEDFTIEMEGENFTINYGEFFYRITLSMYDNDFKITYSPGVVRNLERIDISCSEFERIIGNSVHTWLGRVKEDLLTPLQQRFATNQLEEFHNVINEKLKDIDDSYFSAREGNELKLKLDALKEDFVAASQENDEIRDELERLKSEIDFLKETINTVTKKKWLRNAMAKFFAWSQKKENQELIKSGVETIKTIAQVDLPDMK